MNTKALLAATALIGFFGVHHAYAAGITSGCQGGFCIENEDGDEIKMFNDVANKDVDHFFGSVHGNGKPDFTTDITVHTVGNVDTGSGYANIKPIKDGTLSSITYTVNPLAHLLSNPIPKNDVMNFLDGFFTRAQLDGPCPKKGDCNAVVEMTVNGSWLFDYTVSANGKDFSTIGFDEADETKPGTLVQSVSLAVLTDGFSFKEVKQTDWSPCDGLTRCDTVVINPTGGIPEPSTWAMGIMGFSLVGLIGFAKTRKGARAIA